MAELSVRSDCVPGADTFAAGIAVPAAVHTIEQELGPASARDLLLAGDGGEDYHRARRFVNPKRLSFYVTRLYTTSTQLAASFSRLRSA